MVPKQALHVDTGSPRLPVALCPRSCGPHDKVCGLPARLESTRELRHQPPLLPPRLLTHLSREEGPDRDGRPLQADRGAQVSLLFGPQRLEVGTGQGQLQSPWEEPSPAVPGGRTQGREYAGGDTQTGRPRIDTCSADDLSLGLFLPCQGLPIITLDL